MKIRLADFFENKTNIFLFLLIPTLLLYAKTLSFGFTQLDEKWLILDRVDSLKLWSSLPGAFTATLYEMYYRPLLAVSIFVDYKLGGISPFIYHLTNLLWHLASVFLLFRMLVVFNVSRKKAAVLTLLFSVHPILVHAVAWVPGRNDLMLCVFTLASLIYLKKYLIFLKTKFLVLNIFFFICALFTKENAFLLPLLFFYSAYKPTDTKKLYFAGVFWIIAAGLWLIIRNIVVIPSTISSPLPFTTRFLNFISGLTLYTGKSFFPVNQSVHPTVEPIALLCGVLSFLILGFLFFRPGILNSKTALTGLLLFFIPLILPLWFSSGKSNSELYEHRIYTSLCGIVLFISQIKFDFHKKWVNLFFAVILVLFFFKSFLRLNVYRNADTFVTTAIKEQPGYFMFQAQYATYLSRIGNYSAAIPYYTQAIASRPDKHQYYKDRGYAYFLLGNFKAAIIDLNSAIRISGFNAEYYLDRCAIYYASDDVENSVKDLSVLLECCQKLVPQELKSGVSKKWRLVIQTLDNKLLREPDNSQLLYQRARLLLAAGQKEKGIADLQKALQLSPGNPEYQKLFNENV